MHSPRHPSPRSQPTVDRRRVAALALTLSAHVVAVGVLVLPDVRALETRHAADAVGAVEDRLTLFVELPSPPPAPLPVAPAPPPPPPRPVPAIPMRAAAPAPDAPRESVPAPVPAAPVLIAIANPQAPLAAPAAVLATPAATPTPATSAQARRERDAYIRALMAALLQHRSYPPEARRERARGVVQLRFTVSRDGRVLASQVARSAGHPMLDEAALAVLAAADPLPAIPPSLGRETLTVTVPVEYSLITR